MFNWKRQKQGDGPAVLDEPYLERLAGHVGDDVLRELLSDGVLELSDRLETVAEQVRIGDREQVARLVHDIAGVSGHLGLSLMSAAAVQMERDLRDPSSDIASVVTPLKMQTPDAIAAVRDFLDGAPSD